MPLYLSNRQRKIRGSWETLRLRGEEVLAALDATDNEVSLALVSNSRIQELNRTFRGNDTPTDVLSFSLGEEGLPPGIPRALGDVVISVEKAERQAAERGKELNDPSYALLDEMTFLLIHGVLHLLGYDHEEDGEAVEMEQKEAELFLLFSTQPPRAHHMRT